MLWPIHFVFTVNHNTDYQLPESSFLPRDKWRYKKWTKKKKKEKFSTGKQHYKNASIIFNTSYACCVHKFYMVINARIINISLPFLDSE